jgi:hypothetical protein
LYTNKFMILSFVYLDFRVVRINRMGRVVVDGISLNMIEIMMDDVHTDYYYYILIIIIMLM